MSASQLRGEVVARGRGARVGERGLRRCGILEAEQPSVRLEARVVDAVGVLLDANDLGFNLLDANDLSLHLLDATDDDLLHADDADDRRSHDAGSGVAVFPLFRFNTDDYGSR